MEKGLLELYVVMRVISNGNAFSLNLKEKRFFISSLVLSVIGIVYGLSHAL